MAGAPVSYDCIDDSEGHRPPETRQKYSDGLRHLGATKPDDEITNTLDFNTHDTLWNHRDRA